MAAITRDEDLNETLLTALNEAGEE
jgi:hypothetical protein